MQDLIETIRVAVSSDATKEQKAAGAAACRTIFAALDTEPGKAFTLPGAPAQAVPRVSLDQVLDLMIAKLTTIATERETDPTLAAPSAPDPTTPVLAAPALPIPARLTRTVPPASQGLRVPMAQGSALKSVARSAPTTRRKP